MTKKKLMLRMMMQLTRDNPEMTDDEIEQLCYKQLAEDPFEEELEDTYCIEPEQLMSYHS